MLLVISYILLGGLVFLGAKNIYKFLTKYYKQPLLTNTYAEFIPSLYIKDGVVFNNNDTYSSVLKIEGFKYYESSNLSETMENNFKIKQRALNMAYLQENIQVKLLFKRAKTKEGYENNNYIEITAESLESLKDTKQSLIGSLSQYHAVELKNTELQDFIFFNTNLVKRHLRDHYTEADKEGVSLGDACSYSSVVVNEKEGEYYIENLDMKKHFKVLSVNFGKEIELKYFFELITKNIEFDYVFNSKFFTNIGAKGIIGTEVKNISMSDSEKKASVSELKKLEIAFANQQILNEEETLIIGDCFLIVYADNQEELEESLRIIQNLCSKYELFLVQESYLSLFFFMQRITGFRMHHGFKFLVPYSDISVYAKKILSSSLAGSFDYIDTPKGLSTCDWGEKEICTFNTHYNNVYKFYMHVSEQKTEVGHGVVIAPTGGGKTTFVQYLIKGIVESYNDVDIYSFDRFNGIKIFTYWQKGKNINFEDCEINPLQVDLSMQGNKDFLYNFLVILCSEKGELSQEVESHLSILINLISETPMEHRNLKYLKQAGLLHDDIERLLQKWIEGSYAHYINAKEDSFELEDRFYNFQMDKILEDEVLCAPILYYVMFKIRQKAQKQGRGHFVFIDEAAAMVRNGYFQEQIKVFLNEHRKLRGCVWLAFQNPNTFLEDDKLKQLILSQCQNQIVFTSNSMSKDVLDKLSIDKSIYDEIETAKRDNKDQYYVLIKRPNENVILNTNLVKKKEEIRLYSSATTDVNKVEEIRKSDEENWVEIYLSQGTQEIKEVRKEETQEDVLEKSPEDSIQEPIEEAQETIKQINKLVKKVDEKVFAKYKED